MSSRVRLPFSEKSLTSRCLSWTSENQAKRSSRGLFRASALTSASAPTTRRSSSDLSGLCHFKAFFLKPDA